MIKWNYLTISKRTISRRKKNHSKFLFYSSWIHVWSLEVENLILLCMTVWNLRLLWNPYSIFTLQDNWKTNIKIPINPCGLSLLRTPPTSYTHYIKQSLTDLLNYKWDIQRFHLNLCEFVHLLYGTKIPANGFWKKLNNRLSYFDKQWRWNSLLALTALWQTVLFSLDAWRFPFNKRLVFLVFLHQFVLRYLYFI